MYQIFLLKWVQKMLQIYLEGKEYFNEITNTFATVEGRTISLEHSLFAISKWESKWKKSFINTKEFTSEEILDYIRCMTIDEDVNPYLYLSVTKEIINIVVEYINSKQTATTFSNINEPRSREIVTAEIVYYWMFSLNIPLECEHWNFDKLTTLIRVCTIKNSPPKKMSKKETRNQYRELNKARRNKYKTKG